jgi:hypothetical protein
MKRIEFDGEIHEFPDDFTDDDIAAALDAPKPAGMGDVKMAESQVKPPEPVDITDRPYMNPGVNLGLKMGRAGLQFAGNVAQALSTGPINAIAQGIQDDAGFWGTAGNVARAVVDPVIPGKSPIQDSRTSFARAGVSDVAPQPVKEYSVPVGPYPNMGPRYSGGYSPAQMAGFAADFATPLYGLSAVKAAGQAARLALKTKPAMKAAEATGKALEGYGLDQMKRVVVPLMRHERKAKKPINEVIFEYGLDKADDAAKGASPETMFGRADAKLKDLSKQLKTQIQAGKDAGARVDIDQIIREAVADVKAGGGDSPEFYDMIGDVDEVAKDIATRARAANPYGKLDLAQAQAFKQYSGTKGAWEQYAKNKGIPVTSKESVESRLAESIYHKLNDQIDELAPEGVREINRQISELIPAHQALGWRQLIDNRKAKYSMTDAVGMLGVAIDPKLAAIYGLKKASQSGTVASKVYRLGEALRNAKTPAAKARAIDAFKRIGMTDEEIQAATDVMERSSGDDVYSGLNFQVRNAPVEAPPQNAVPWKPMETKGTEGRMQAINAHNRRMQATQYLQKTLGREPEQGEVYRFLDQNKDNPIPKAPEAPKQTREFKGRRNVEDLGSREQMIRKGDPEYPTTTVPAKDGPDSFTLNGETYKRVKGGYDNIVTYKDSKGRPYTWQNINEPIHMDDPARPFKVADDAPKPMAQEADDFLDENGQPLFQAEKLQSPKGQILRREKGVSNITLFKGKADVSTVVHEHAHKLRTDLDEATNQRLLKAIGGKTWDTAAEERFARGWERYLYNGEAPSKELGKTFGTMKERLRKIYQDTKGTAIEEDISPEMQIIFDAVLLKNKKVTPRARTILSALKKGTTKDYARQRLLIALEKEMEE